MAKVPQFSESRELLIDGTYLLRVTLKTGDVKVSVPSVFTAAIRKR